LLKGLVMYIWNSFNLHQNFISNQLTFLIYYYTNRLIRQIRYKESSLHVKLARHRRHQSLAASKTIGVCPQIIVDVPTVSSNHIQSEYLSHTGKFKMLSSSYLDYSILFFFLI
jgi:hypothetical protein